MSGDTYNHAYRHLEDLASAIRARAETELSLTDDVRALRHEFADRLDLFAKAAHDVEWVDSGDTVEGSEVEAIRAALKGEVAPREPESLTVMAESITRAGFGRDTSLTDGTACFASARLPRVHMAIGTDNEGAWVTVTVGATSAVAAVDATGPRLWPTVCAALRKAIIWCAENDERQAEDALRRVLEEVARV